MIFASLLAAALSLTASAQASDCRSNEMTSAWEKVTFGLWLSDYTVPEDSTRTATLAYIGCTALSDGTEARFYRSEDRAFTLSAFTNAGGENGATTLALTRRAEKVELGTWGHHKVFYKGVGIDKVAVPNGNGRTVVKNVFVLPVKP